VTAGDGDFWLAAQEYDPAVPVATLSEHPANPNEGDIGAISESMDAHGFYGAVLVQRSTGRILAGNHRYRTAVAKGATTVPGFMLDVDDDAAARILMVDNRSTHLARIDEAKLVALLQPMVMTGKGLAGTGYDGDDLDAMLKLLQPPAPPDGFPGFDGDTIETEHTCPKCGYEWSGQA
jgi:ParB-like nuclease domain